MTISDDSLSKLLFESNNDNAPFHQEKVYTNIEALDCMFLSCHVRV